MGGVFWVLCLNGFISFLQAGILGKVTGAGINRITQLFRCALSGAWLLLIGLHQGRVISSAAGPGITHLVLLLFWAWS